MQSLEFIDDYFRGDFLPEQKRQFEERIQTDQSFAEEVAFYLAAIQAARNQNNEDKKERFRKIYLENKERQQVGPVRRLWPYVASIAAILTAIIVGVYLYTSHQTPPQLASEYIEHHFSSMGIQMGSSADDMEHAKRLYNEGKLREALLIFENLARTDTANYDAREMAGISALKLRNFDEAIAYFSQMETNTALHVNAGKFYHALALMQRDFPGDKVKAKSLLLEVVSENLAGNQDARKFLKHFN